MRNSTDEFTKGRSCDRQSPFEIVVIGASLGGLSALEVVLTNLPANFPVAIAVVLHRHKNSYATLGGVLQTYTPLVIKEAEDKEKIVAGHIYLAPADYHLLIEKDHFALSTDAPVAYARPSIDVLFESAADAYAQRTIGVILTGSNRDGARGLARIQARGGRTIVQEPQTAESRTMPEAAIAGTTVDWILPLPKIPLRLINLCSPALR